MQRQPLNGIYNVLKPSGMTSSDAVVKLRSFLQHKFDQKITVGHLGTLDPGASGVLAIGVGNGVKLFSTCNDNRKEYLAGFRFGITTDTLDSYGAIIQQGEQIDESKLEDAIQSMIGKQTQIPPLYSANSIDGKRAYDLARQGQEFTLVGKEIHIYDFQFKGKSADGQYMFNIVCSGGTYIRSIVRDLAEKLGTVGYMSFLLRTKSHGLTLDKSATLSEIESDYQKGFIDVVEYLSNEPNYNFCEEQRFQLDNGVKLDIPLEEQKFVNILCNNMPYGWAEVTEGKVKIIFRYQ